VAGGFLFMVWAAIPRNGAYVGWIETGLYVPDAAWGLFRLLTEILSGGALMAASVRLIEGFYRATGRYQASQVDWS